MILTAPQKPSQVTGMKANGFQMTNSAKIVDMVISKLYSNKPGAVIRELASNAWDAHCEAGNQKTPFEIHLPTWLDKTFMIRDYGTGIPHDKFEFIYTNIGGSTKEHSNDFLGGFGVGSKASFTMVDSFTVENWRDGIKSTWLCFKDSGAPQVTMLAKEPSDEPSGLKVSFVFEEDEVAEFTRQLTKQLRYFPTKPVITGGEGVGDWTELPDGWETKEYFYTTERNPWQRYHHVVMGNVAYELNPSEIPGDNYGLFTQSLTIKVPIGAVDIPPSREHLEYTKKTKDYLGKVLKVIRDTYNKEFMDGLDNAKTYLDFRKKFDGANGNLISLRTFEFDNVEYSWHHLTRNHLLQQEHGLNIKVINSRYSNVFRGTYVHLRDVIDGLHLYINDLGVGASRHINDEHHKIPDDYYIIDPIKGTKETRQSLLDADKKKAKDFFGVEPKLLSTLIGFPVKTKGTTTRAKPDQIFKVTRKGHNVKTSVEVTQDIPTTGYMLPMLGWDVGEGFFRNRVCDLGKFVEELDEPVYLVRKHTRKSVVGLKGEKELRKALDKLLLPRVIRYQKTKELQGLLPHNSMRNLLPLEWKGVDPTLYLVTKFYNRITKERLNHFDYQYASSLVTEVPETSAFISSRTKSLIEKYNNKYSKLIDALGSGWNTSSNFQNFHTFLTTKV